MKTEAQDWSEQLFLILAGIFIAALICSNLIFQKFFRWSPLGIYTFELSVGIIPYPITFLCTDLISELYGRQKADRVVMAGLVASLFILVVVVIANSVPTTTWSPLDRQTFTKVFGLFAPAVAASLLAYLTAQFLDIRLFHFWKRLTKGKHLWLRNNGSTIVSQLVDTASVLSLLCFTQVLDWSQFVPLLQEGFLFKVLVALADTPFFYLGVWLFQKRVGLDRD